ncbi:hypothetical protein HK096_010812 [Nowakowskiella sp. JEL0078]|nr:hypothetical protein HK096_010812 [Nowakowskiella sp. JEL0078]
MVKSIILIVAFALMSNAQSVKPVLTNPAIPSCDSLLSNAVMTKFTTCGAASGSTLFANSTANWQTVNTNECTNLLCANADSTLAKYLNGVCPTNYVGAVTLQFGTVFPPIAASSLFSSPIYTQAQLDADFRCVKVADKICNVEFKAAITAASPSKDLVCTSCTQLLFATYDSQKLTYEPLTEVIVDLASTRNTVISLCGSDFLSKVTVATAISSSSTTSLSTTGAVSSVTLSTAVTTSDAGVAAAATTTAPAKSTGVKVGVSFLTLAVVLASVFLK